MSPKPKLKRKRSAGRSAATKAQSSPSTTRTDRSAVRTATGMTLAATADAAGSDSPLLQCKPRRVASRLRREHMGWIIALIVGGVAGWLASMVMNRNASMGIFWNIIVGIVGSLIGNLIA